MMAHLSNIQSAPLRFCLPRSLQLFDIFQSFPYDIRHSIWEAAIFSPGIHFLKFVEIPNAATTPVNTSAQANSGASPVTLFERRTEDALDAAEVVYSANLQTEYPLSCADSSHYKTMNETLRRLRNTCNEAAYIISTVLAQPNNLTLDDGQLVLLQRSADIVCIDYPSITHGRSLGRWAERLNLDQLSKVRRLAVRYHHEWDNDQIICAHCGRLHFPHERHPYPRHVYEFAALFKNLEAFYFIDYLAIHKLPHSARSASRSRGPIMAKDRFASGSSGRTYFEVDPESCITHTHVHETIPWLRSNYISHCRRKSLGPPCPESVSFKVLGCEWDSDQKLLPPKCQGTQKSPTRNKSARIYTPKRKTSPQSASMRSDCLFSQLESASILPVVFGDHGKSKFEFSFKISR